MITLGSLTVETTVPTGGTVMVARPDPTNPLKQIFDRVAVTALQAPASGGGGGGSGAAGVQTVEVGVQNLSIPASLVKDTAVATMLYQVTDPADVNNLLLLGIEIQYEDVIGAKFTYELWAGDPTELGSQLLATAGQDIFMTAQTNTFTSSAAAYLSNADLRTGLWINVINRLTSPVKFSAKLTFAEFLPPASPVTLPPYVPGSFSYTGPLNLSVVDVGPGQTFPEMADAMPFVAPGFLMRVHAGAYYKPFRVPQGMNGFVITAAPGTTADDIICNGRGGWVSGEPLWMVNEPPGDGPVNPFRLAQGKGFILTNSPGTIRGLSFWNCGGAYGAKLADNYSDAEAGIYAESFAAPGDLHVEHCTFDGNEDGIFVPPVTGNGANVRLYIDHCDFSFQLENGVAPDGLSHNVYVNGLEVHATNSNFYGCQGNSFKSRSPLVTIDACFIEAGGGRGLDFADGGSLTVTNTIFSQKTAGQQHNYIGLANENQNNGPAHATFSACTLRVRRGDSMFLIKGTGSYGHFSPAGGTPCTVEWFTGDDPNVSLNYDTGFGSSTSGVDGLPGQTGSTLPYTPAQGGTVVAGTPPRPAVVHLS